MPGFGRGNGKGGGGAARGRGSRSGDQKKKNANLDLRLTRKKGEREKATVHRKNQQKAWGPTGLKKIGIEETAAERIKWCEPGPGEGSKGRNEKRVFDKNQSRPMVASEGGVPNRGCASLTGLREGRAGPRRNRSVLYGGWFWHDPRE